MNSSEIGVVYTIYGTFGMFVQFFLFPPLARKLGVLKLFKVCSLVFPFMYVLVPFTSLLSTQTMRQGVCLILMLIKCAVGIFSFPCSIIMLTNSAVSLSILGTLNGVSTSSSAAGRAIGPALVGWIFTMGVDAGYVVMPFWTMAVLALISAIPIWWLIEMDGPHAKTNNAKTRDDFNPDDVDLEDIEEERFLREQEDLDIASIGDMTGVVVEVDTKNRMT